MNAKTVVIVILAVLVAGFVAVKFSVPSDAHVVVDQAYFTKGTQMPFKLVVSVGNTYENGMFRYEIIDSKGTVIMKRAESSITADRGLTITTEFSGNFVNTGKYTIVVYSLSKSEWIKTDEKVIEMRF